MANIKGKFVLDGEISSAKLSTAVNNSISAAQAKADAAIPATEKGAASGVAPLGADSKIAATYLPSYVDDVVEYSALGALPAVGVAGIIYITLDTNLVYRWSGSTYIQIASGAVSSVNGQTGAVVLTTTNIAEGTNLYFTDARARTAAVADAIADGVLNVAPSQNAVFDALALKQALLTCAKETITVTAAQFTAQAVLLANAPKANSLLMWIDGVMQVEGVIEDFTVSGTTVTFVNGLATGGVSAVVAGDRLRFAYMY